MKTKRNIIKKNETAGQLAEALLTAAGLCYPTDPCQAGIVVSRLPSGVYYASLCRYTERYGGGKVVVCKATADTYEGALVALCRTWRGAPRDAASALAALDNIIAKTK
jgi:hypothetical protein